MNRHARALLQHMEWMSNKYFNSPWEEDLDYILFDIVKEQPARIGTQRADPLDIRQLSNLFEVAGGIWVGDTHALEFLRWEAWQKRTGLVRRVNG